MLNLPTSRPSQAQRKATEAYFSTYISNTDSLSREHQKQKGYVKLLEAKRKVPTLHLLIIHRKGAERY